MSDYVENQLEFLLKSVEVLKREVDNELLSLKSPTAQISRLSNSLSSFVDDTLDSIAGNEDMVAVNRTAITSLAQIKNFMLNEPNRLAYTMAAFGEKQKAYDSCLELIKKSANMVEPPPGEDETIEIGDENEEVASLSASSRPRSVGGRPESLRKTRQEIYKNLGEESSPEDI